MNTQKFCVILKNLPIMCYLDQILMHGVEQAGFVDVCGTVQCNNNSENVCLHVIQWKFACKNNDCLWSHRAKTVLMHVTHRRGGQQQIAAIVLGLAIYFIMLTLHTHELCHTQESGLARTLSVFFTLVLRPSLPAFQQSAWRSAQQTCLPVLYLGQSWLIRIISHPKYTCTSNNDDAILTLVWAS